DDAAVTAGGQGGQRGLNDENGPFEVHREHLFDVVGGEVFKPAGREDAGVGADDVQAAVALDRGFDGAPAIVRVRHIGRQPAHPSGLVAEIGLRGVEFGLVAGDHQDVHAAGGEGGGDSAA